MWFHHIYLNSAIICATICVNLRETSTRNPEPATCEAQYSLRLTQSARKTPLRLFHKSKKNVPTKVINFLFRDEDLQSDLLMNV